MGYENNDKKIESVYSNRVKAGKRRTYFFDVRETRGNDFFLTITESRKRFDSEGYDRHKIFLYKEDFNKFVKGLNEAVDYVKTELMPDFDFDAFNHDTPYEGGDDSQQAGTSTDGAIAAAGESPANFVTESVETKASSSESAESKVEEAINPGDNHHSEEVDKW